MDALPFDHSRGGLMVIEAGLAARPADRERRVDVVVDTGAGGPFALFISNRLAKKLKLPLSAEVTPATNAAIGANPPGFRRTSLDRFTLGPVRIDAPAVAATAVVDDVSGHIGQRIDGIVGASFLRPLVFSIDFPAQRLDLQALPGPATAAQPLRYAPTKPLILVTATINGHGPFTLELDTGASVTSLSPAAAARAGVVTTGSNQLIGAGGAVAIGTGAARIASGGVAQDLPQVSITAAIDDIARAIDTPIDGILGLDWLHRVRLTIDGPGERWWVSAD